MDSLRFDITSNSCPSRCASRLGRDLSLKLELLLSKDRRASKSSRVEAGIGKDVRNETSGECVEWREFDEKSRKLVGGSGGCVEEMDGILPEVEGGGKNDNRDVGTR